jgi:hypothetical protein
VTDRLYSLIVLTDVNPIQTNKFNICLANNNDMQMQYIIVQCPVSPEVNDNLVLTTGNLFTVKVGLETYA